MANAGNFSDDPLFCGNKLPCTFVRFKEAKIPIFMDAIVIFPSLEML